MTMLGLNIVSLVSLAATAVMAIIAYIFAFIIGKKSSKTDKFVLFWLIWDAMIHITIEGPFVYLSLTGTVAKSNHWIAEIWKEYGQADKRWLVSDPTIVSLEILTVILDSFLCIVLIYAIYHDRFYRHWLQLVLCVCELYGGWMTFCPELLIGSPNLATDNFLHLWVYLVFFNGLWVIIPAALMYQSWNAMQDMFSNPGQRSSLSKQKSGRYNLRNKKTH